jgi:tripartite-type tricarboxylate transporter receptor subunit TctC
MVAHAVGRPLAGISTEENAMVLARRRFLRFAGSAVAGVALPRLARALDYPGRPVRIVVGFAAGGSTDMSARLIAQWLTDRLGQSFIVENRPGASSNIGTEVVVNARPDGYTLLMAGNPNAINATLYGNLSFNFIRDIAPVAGLMRVPNVMEVHPSVPAGTVPEFIAYAKANPGQINVTSAGTGTTAHLSGDLFQMLTGVHLTHVPYRGSGPMLIDLIGGQVQAAFDNMPSSIAYIRAGKLRALAVTTATRSQALPDIPCVGEFVPGYEASGWFGLGAPRGTPTEIVDLLNREINAGLADPRLEARLADFGGMPLAGSPADFGRLIAEETEKAAKIIKFSGAKPE